MHRFYILILIFGLQSNYLLYSQQYAYKPDSVIRYSIHGIDTNTKQPVEKVLYNYDKDYNILEKRVYIWHQLHNKWELNDRLTFTKYAGEIVETNYDVRSKYESIKYRHLYKLNQQNKIIEVTKDKKEGNETIVLYKTMFEYQNDTLKKIDYFRSSTTFFKEKSKSFSHVKQKIIEKTTFFNEQNPLQKTNLYQTIDINSKFKTTKKTFKYEDKLSDTICITHFNELNQPINDTIFKQLSNSTTKSNVIYISASLFYYKQNKQPLKKIEYKLLPNGKMDLSKTNYMTIYYTNEKAPISLLQIGESMIQEF